MGQSLTKIAVHLTYSTKDRKPRIPKEVRDRLFAYQSGIFREWESPTIIVGGCEDHVHALFLLSRNHSISKIVEEVKKGSSKWMKSDGSGYKGFCWQNGYAGFSVSESNIARVREYIKRQEEHHRRMTFKEELRALFEKHKVEYDERYVWD